MSVLELGLRFAHYLTQRLLLGLDMRSRSRNVFYFLDIKKSGL